MRAALVFNTGVPAPACDCRPGRPTYGCAVHDQVATLDDWPRLYTVWGCPLMTRVSADHPYFGNFHLRVPLAQMDLGQITTARCGTETYNVERVQ